MSAACLETLEKSNLAAFGTGLFVGLVVIGLLMVVIGIARTLRGPVAGGSGGGDG